MNKVICGKVEDVLKDYPPGTFQAVLTDPPYGLGTVKDIHGLLRHWLDGTDGEHLQTSGFMGRDWDAVPSPETWREVLRVLSPGAFIMAFSGCRTQDLMGVSMRLAGFEDNSCLYWMYSSGFPKSTDVSKQIDKRAGAEREVVGKHPAPCTDSGTGRYGWNTKGNGRTTPNVTAPATPLAQTWDGWKYGRQSLKPAAEPILLMNAPYGKSRIDAITEHGSGAINVDGCRIGTEQRSVKTGRSNPNGGPVDTVAYGKFQAWDGQYRTENRGRYPSNVLFSHSPRCQQVGTRKVKGTRPRVEHTGDSTKSQTGGLGIEGGRPIGFVTQGYTSPDGTEEVADFICQDGCAVKMLDEQAGERKSGTYRHASARQGKAGVGLLSTKLHSGTSNAPDNYGDKGTASRFFYTAKASRSEREKGLLGVLPCVKCGGVDTTKHTINGKEGKCIRNDWPTVKPLKITEYLARLLLVPEEYRDKAAILIPFSGTGSEALGAILAGWRNWLAIDMSEHACEIARARIAYWTQQPTLL